MKKFKTGAALCAAEIKAELTAKYPRVKFSVKSEVFAGGDSVDISWNFGPTVEQVKEITAGRQDGYFDGMQDMYINNNTSGKASVKYIHENRGYTEPGGGTYTSVFFAALCEALCKLYRVEYAGPDTQLFERGGYESQVRHYANKALHTTAFTSDNVEFVSVDHNNDPNAPCGHDFIIVYNDLKPETKPAAAITIATDQAPEVIAAEGIIMTDYSERSFMLYGNTYPLKEKIKSLGGRFNGFLKDPNDPSATVKGWIFPITARPAVAAALSL